MREIRQSGSEGGVALTRHPYPYDGAGPLALEQDRALTLKQAGSLALERTKPLILEQTGLLAIPEPSANGAA